MTLTDVEGFDSRQLIAISNNGKGGEAQNSAFVGFDMIAIIIIITIIIIIIIIIMVY